MQTVIPRISETYVKVIRNSPGSYLFRNFYATVNGKRKDIMKDGDLSCAFFVSSILTMFGFIEKIHGTVDGTVKDMEKSGWKKVRSPKPGDVLVWNPDLQSHGEVHKHIGFFIGNNMAMSNRWQKKSPAKHHVTFGTKGGKQKRAVNAIYRKIIDETV